MNLGNILGDLPTLLIIGGIAGYFLGSIIKKLVHLAITIGVIVLLLGYLSITEVINLNFDQLASKAMGYIEMAGSLGLTDLVLSSPFTGSFTFGFLLGFLRG